MPTDDPKVDKADKKFVWEPGDIEFLPPTQTQDLTTTPPDAPKEESK